MPALSLTKTQRRAGSRLRRATSGRREAPALLGAAIPAGRVRRARAAGATVPCLSAGGRAQPIAIGRV